jgi:protein O-mannosyl-transferase
MIPRSIYRQALVAISLTLATVAAYRGVWRNGFIRVDDPYYVTEEPMVTRGLSAEGVVWAFTTRAANNYHPLTWLGHMTTCQLFGLRPSAHHGVNLLLHIINSILLLLVFHRMTGALWPSAFVAAVFALHPLHVESVAWVAELKDVLSTFFGLATIVAYAWYVRDATPMRYVIVFVLLALGLLAKPMLVTLPFVLMLLDVWPLGRSRFWRRSDAPADEEAMGARDLFLEKMPLLLLSVVFAGITIWVQSAAGAVATMNHTPLLARVLNTPMAYGRYVFKTIWPDRLAFYYPYSSVFSLLHLALCVALLIAGTVYSIRWRKIRPWFAVGWFWFVGTLVPVIGIVQAGGQAIADRYMYVPMVGLTIIIAWAAAEYVGRVPKLRPAVVAFAIFALVALGVRTQLQVRHWKNSVTLGLHTLSVAPENNWFIHTLVAGGYQEAGNLDKAIEHMETANRMMPGKYEAIIADLRVQRERQQRSAPVTP